MNEKSTKMKKVQIYVTILDEERNQTILLLKIFLNYITHYSYSIQAALKNYRDKFR